MYKGSIKPVVEFIIILGSNANNAAPINPASPALIPLNKQDISSSAAIFSSNN